MINYFCDSSKIENNALEQLKHYDAMPNIDKLCAFTDIHFCDEKAIPVGVAFSTKDIFYPLVTGKDLGCGVMYMRISKEYWLKPFDKNQHYVGLEKAHRLMTDDGLGGGNHFLSIEEDDKNIYIICHTGSRNRGIEMYQDSYDITKQYSLESDVYEKNVSIEYLKEKYPDYMNKYNSILKFSSNRRYNFLIKTLLFLQQANYIKCDKSKIKTWTNTNFDVVLNKGEMNGTIYEVKDSTHNHLQFKDDSIIHRKGSTEINPGDEVAIPLSMTRGTLIVKAHEYLDISDALNSCAHGAGRKLSRFNAMKHWCTVLKEKERKEYIKNFRELLDKSGKFPSGYIQEFDYAYKDSSDILKQQPYLTKITQTNTIITIKYTEI